MGMLNDGSQSKRRSERAVKNECGLELKADESRLGYKTILRVTVFSMVQS